MKKPPKKTRGADGPTFVDGFLHFGKEDLLRYELAQAKVLNALQAIGLKRSELEKSRLDFTERARVGHAEIQDLLRFSSAREAELRHLQKELEATYGLDLSKATYDDVRGKIMMLGEPIQAPGRKGVKNHG